MFFETNENLFGGWDKDTYLMIHREEIDVKFPTLIDFILNTELSNRDKEGNMVGESFRLYHMYNPSTTTHPKGFVILDCLNTINIQDDNMTLYNIMLDIVSRRRQPNYRWLLIYL